MIPRRFHPTRRRGMATVMAMFLLMVLFTVSFCLLQGTTTTLAQGENECLALNARLAAESGLEFAIMAFKDCQSSPTLTELPDMLTVVYDHLAAKFPDCTVELLLADDEVDYDRVVVHDVELPPADQSFSITIYTTQTDDDGRPTELQLMATGKAGDLTRTLGMRFDVSVNKQLLHYAITSTSRIIARGNVRVHGPVSTSYSRFPHPTNSSVRNHSVEPLNIQLGEDGFIDGTIGTSDSKADFTGDPALGDEDFHNGLTHAGGDDLTEQLVYNEPDGATLDVDDFDTSPLKAMTDTANLPSADSNGNEWDGWGSEDGKPALENICVPKGANPVFRNCTFRGITYIEVDEETAFPSESNQNAVRFVNCTFEGPIITGVPKKMDWNRNKMTFEGDTIFKGSMIQEALGGVTLMAPNYNVNLGGDEGGGGYGESEIVGLVVGGCVDLYNHCTVHGTIVSMANLVDENGDCIMNKRDGWVASTGVCGANLGNLDGSSDAVDIYPDPNNVIPLGVKKRYKVYPNAHSYQEYPAWQP